MDQNDMSLREEIFYDAIREQVICFMLFLGLFFLSYVIISRFKKPVDDYIIVDDINDVILYNLSVLICSAVLGVIIGETLLLPFSIVSNEILLLYSGSYYTKWLNESLVQGLWNYIFILSNISLVLFLPLAIFLIQSVGFSYSYNDLRSRFMESALSLAVIALVIFGTAYIFSKIINRNDSAVFSFLDICTYYPPFVYAFGCLLLLICAPLGFAHLFTVVGKSLFNKSPYDSNVEDIIMKAQLEQMSLQRRLDNSMEQNEKLSTLTNISKPYLRHRSKINGEVRNKLDIRALLNSEIQKKKRPFISSRLIYIIEMIVLLSLTITTVLLVFANTIELLIGHKTLTNSSRKFTLGISSLSMLGVYGACFEIILILYLLMASVIGLYSFPVIACIHPRLGKTPLYHIMGNCFVLLILCSALPLMVKMLGITNFDLLGNFGQIEWLGSFKVVLFYNALFSIMSAVCLTCNATMTFYEEVYQKLIHFYSWMVSIKIKCAHIINTVGRCIMTCLDRRN